VQARSSNGKPFTGHQNDIMNSSLCETFGKFKHPKLLLLLLFACFFLLLLPAWACLSGLACLGLSA